MKLYRVAPASRIDDLSGTGARIAGGRWNRPGLAVVYCSGSVSLALLEYLVHLGSYSLMPADIQYVVLELEGRVTPVQVDTGTLPRDWYRFPAPASLLDYSDAWLKDMKSPVLKVPSSIVHEEYNYILNPMHPGMKKIKVLYKKSLPAVKRFGK